MFTEQTTIRANENISFLRAFNWSVLSTDHLGTYNLIYPYNMPIDDLTAVSVTRLGDFWKFSMTNIHAKVAQKLCDFLAF